MKKIRSIFAAAFLVLALPLEVIAAEVLIPVGQVVGLQLENGAVTVAALDSDSLCPGAEALRVGDRITKIDGNTIGCTEDVRRALTESSGQVELQIFRDGKSRTLRLTPNITKEGPKIGVFLRQGVTGIGTVTFYDPETGQFGTLGHGVNTDTGALIPIRGGSAYAARVLSVRKGKAGAPGQLMGAVADTTPIGVLNANRAQGVFGKTDRKFPGEAIPVGTADTVQTGAAKILSTIEGDSVREYSVEILKIYPKDRANGRNLLLKVTDQTLLETTGGIVQGMSGSPIIQDGKLVGAVTHVLVNDPTTGYGIFIENMLDAAA